MKTKSPNPKIEHGEEGLTGKQVAGPVEYRLWGMDFQQVMQSILNAESESC